MPFLTEEAQRAANFSKTPDIRLIVPIEAGGKVVYWIDSKACFGDPHTLRTSYQHQFRQYLKLLGPGMVIYWFGFVRGSPPLDTGESAGSGTTKNECWLETDLLLLDKFPESVVRNAMGHA